MSNVSKMELLQFGVGVQFQVSNEIPLVSGVGGVMSGDISSGGKVDFSGAPIYHWVGASKPGES